MAWAIYFPRAGRRGFRIGSPRQSNAVAKLLAVRDRCGLSHLVLKWSLTVFARGRLAAFVGVGVICAMRRKFMRFKSIDPVSCGRRSLAAWRCFAAGCGIGYATDLGSHRYNISARYESMDFAVRMGNLQHSVHGGVGGGTAEGIRRRMCATGYVGGDGNSSGGRFATGARTILGMVWADDRSQSRQNPSILLAILSAGPVRASVRTEWWIHYGSRGPVKRLARGGRARRSLASSHRAFTENRGF